MNARKHMRECRGLKAHPGGDDDTLRVWEDFAIDQVRLQRRLVHAPLDEHQERLDEGGAQREAVHHLVTREGLQQLPSRVLIEAEVLREQPRERLGGRVTKEGVFRLRAPRDSSSG